METATETRAGRVRKVGSIVGKIEITEKQAQKLSLKKNTRLSPVLEKCCLLLVANESFEDAEEDILMMTGIAVSGSSQHRLVEKYEFKETDSLLRAEALSLDGGKVRIRTPQGQSSSWKDYKAVSLHESCCAAFFQNNQELVDWTNRQPLARMVTCLGDGHDGVWNLITQIGEEYQRREVLDWYHLVENLNKVGGSLKRLKRVENFLWSGEIEPALAEFKSFKRPSVINFQRYLNKHRTRIPDYSLYQELGICIGSGSVESTIKRIGARIKIVGAQYLEKNVSQYLKLRCAYLNHSLA